MVVPATERTDGSPRAHEVSRAKVYAWDLGWSVVIRCDCGEQLVLTEDRKSADGCEATKRLSTPKESFYSWLDGHQDRLAGKEERSEYYGRLEEQARPR